MSRRIVACLAALAVVGLSSGARAQEARKDAGAPKGASKLETRELAASINFAKSFDLPFESLATLGSRVDQARKTPDPICLASAANELMVAEKVSGKKAGLTSQDLMKEAIGLGLVRFSSAELRALSLMVADPAEHSRLDTFAGQAKNREDDRAAAQKVGEVSMGLNGWLSVNNYTDDFLTILVDGRQVGVAPPHTNCFRLSFINDNPNFPTELHAAGPFGRSSHLSLGQFVTGDYTWSIGL